MSDFEFDDDDIFGSSSNSSSDLSGFGSDDDDLFGSSSSSSTPSSSSETDTSSSFESSKSSKSESSDEDKAKTKKKIISLVFILGGIILAVIVFSILGNNSKFNSDAEQQAPKTTNNSGTADQQSQEASNSSQINTGTSTQQVEQGGWSELNSFDVEWSSQIKSVFTINNIRYYGRQTGSDRLEVKAEVTGAIDGLQGEFRMDVPWYVIPKLALGDRVTVYYRIGQYKDYSFIGDVRWEE